MLIAPPCRIHSARSAGDPCDNTHAHTDDGGKGGKEAHAEEARGRASGEADGGRWRRVQERSGPAGLSVPSRARD